MSSDGTELLVGTTHVTSDSEADAVNTWYVLNTQTLTAAADPWVVRLGGHEYRGSSWLGDRALVIYFDDTDFRSTVFSVREQKAIFSEYVHPSNMALSPDGRWLAIVDSDLGVIDVYAPGSY